MWWTLRIIFKTINITKDYNETRNLIAQRISVNNLRWMHSEIVFFSTLFFRSYATQSSSNCNVLLLFKISGMKLVTGRIDAIHNGMEKIKPKKSSRIVRNMNRVRSIAYRCVCVCVHIKAYRREEVDSLSLGNCFEVHFIANGNNRIRRTHIKTYFTKSPLIHSGKATKHHMQNVMPIQWNGIKTPLD